MSLLENILDVIALIGQHVTLGQYLGHNSINRTTCHFRTIFGT